MPAGYRARSSGPAASCWGAVAAIAGAGGAIAAGALAPAASCAVLAPARRKH
jgi:hypothetical protein